MIDKIKKHPYIFFTILFCITCLGVFIWFPLAKRGFIWTGETQDGLVQHYNALMYYGKYLRHIVTHFEIPMWDFGIGYGADIIATLHYYTIGDPLNLLSVFVQPKYTEYLYVFLILLRFFLSGIAFIKYSLYMNRSKMGSIVGAIVYAFCGYAIFANVRHPYFANPMIYLPFILMGVEKIYKKESPTLFIVSIFIATMSNFYFLYMLVVFTVLYCIFRFFAYYHDDYIKNIFKKIIQFLCYSIVGIMMAAVILIPVLILFFNTSRSQATVSIPMFYESQYYIKLLFGCTTFTGAKYWSLLGYSCVSIISIIVMFMDKKQSKSLKIIFILLTLGLCIPFFGSLMNGMSYVSNRWVFGYSLLIAFIVASYWDKLFELSTKQLVILVVACLCYSFGMVYFEVSTLINRVTSVVLLIGMVIVLCIYHILQAGKVKKIISYVSVLLLVITSVSVTAHTKYVEYHYTKAFAGLTRGYTRLVEKSRYSILNEISDNSFYRVDSSSKKPNIRNSGLQYNQSSLSFFYSLGSGYTSEFLDDMNIPNILSSKYEGLDSRVFLETLASTKYYLGSIQAKDGPYGFEKTSYENENTKVFKNNYALPLGYTYESYIDYQAYKKMNALEKQEAMMQGVVLEGQQTLRKSDVQLYQGVLTKSSKKQIIVDNNPQQYQLASETDGHGEIYLKINHLYLSNYKHDEAKIKIYVDGKKKKTFTLRTKDNPYYDDKHDFLINLGYFDDFDGVVSVEFEEKGTYTFDSMELYNQSMESYDDYVKALKESTLENVQMSTNQVNGTIELDSRKFLCLTIPYSTGWSAYVDGEKVELQRANVMYMGMTLQPGKHKIQLKYQTPGLKYGLILSVIGCGLFVFIVIRNKKKRNT